MSIIDDIQELIDFNDEDDNLGEQMVDAQKRHVQAFHENNKQNNDCIRRLADEAFRLEALAFPSFQKLDRLARELAEKYGVKMPQKLKNKREFESFVRKLYEKKERD